MIDRKGAAGAGQGVLGAVEVLVNPEQVLLGKREIAEPLGFVEVLRVDGAESEKVGEAFGGRASDVARFQGADLGREGRLMEGGGEAIEFVFVAEGVLAESQLVVGAQEAVVDELAKDGSGPEAGTFEDRGAAFEALECAARIVQIRSVDVVLGVGGLAIGAGDAQGEFLISADILGEGFEVRGRPLDHHLAGLEGPAQGGELRGGFEDEDLGHPAGGGEAALGSLTLTLHLEELPEEHRESDSRDGDGGAVAPDELVREIEEGRTLGADGIAAEIAGNIIAEFLSAAVTTFGFLGHGLEGDGGEIAGEGGGRRGGMVRDVVDRFVEGKPVDGLDGFEGEHLPEEQAQGIDVGGDAGVQAAGLFGTRVGEGEGAKLRAADAGFAEIEEFGDAEVEDLGVAVGGDEDVGGLQVAVNDQLLVSGMNGGTNLAKEMEARGGIEGAAGIEQGLAVEPLHDEVAAAIGDAAVQELDDVRVRESGQDLAFAEEHAFGIAGGEGSGDHFERDFLIEFTVIAAGAVDDAHAALGDAAGDAVGAKAFAGRDRFIVLRFDETARAQMRTEQRLDFGTDGRGESGKETRALVAFAFDGFPKRLTDLVPERARHRFPGVHGVRGNGIGSGQFKILTAGASRRCVGRARRGRRPSRV